MGVVQGRLRLQTPLAYVPALIAPVPRILGLFLGRRCGNKFLPVLGLGMGRRKEWRGLAVRLLGGQRHGTRFEGRRGLGCEASDD